jgi:DNA-binding PadR family transcriptional regulator
MLLLAVSPRSRSEIAEGLGHKSVSGSLRQALADLMKQGVVAYTIPEKPNSRLQQYRLTGKGRKTLAEQADKK